MDIMYSTDELEGMKYAKLQELAKEAGIKANVKAEKLVRDLAKHYESMGSGSSEESDAKSPSEKPTSRKIAKGKKGKGRKKQTKAEESPSQAEEQGESEEKCTKTPKAATPKPNRLSVIKAEESKASPKVSPKTASSVLGSPAVRKLSSRNSKGTPQDSLVTRKSKGTPASAQGMKRKRQNEDSLQKTTPPQDQQPESRTSTGRAKRVRTNTYDKEDNRVSTGSTKRTRTGTYDKEDSIILSSNQSSKNSTPVLQGGKTKSSGSDKKKNTAEKEKKNAEVSKQRSQTNIPRFAAFAAKKKAEKKPVTPGNKDWAKIHQKNFDKMDSLDVYLEKKRERTKSITESVKKARMLTEQAKASVQKLKNHRTPTQKGPKIAKPVKASLFKSPHSGVPFVPSITSTTKMNLNFNSILKSPAPKSVTLPVEGAKPKAVTVQSPARAVDKENKEKRKSVVDSRKSIGDSRKSIGSSRKSIGAGRKSIGDSRKSLGTTHFKFGASALVNTTLDTTQTVTSTKKAVFDLKASLAKPITWKAYTGKMKPISDKSTSEQQQMANKGPKLQTRDDRRTAANIHRANKKFDTHMNRRKINV